MSDYLRIQLGPVEPLSDVLSSVAAEHAGGRLRIATAWANDAGVKWLLSATGPRINELELVVGINAQLTTVEALIRLLDAGAKVALNYRHPRRLFHPKVYWFTGGAAGTNATTVIVGSSNLTSGGLRGNVEGSLIVSTSDDREAKAADMVVSLESAWTWLNASPFAYPIAAPTDLQRFFEIGRIVTERYLARTRRRAAEEELGSGDDAPAGLPIESGEVQVPPALAPVVIPFDTDDDEPPETELFEGSVFLMTLQRTDAGEGQTTEGAARRSPEIFIPLAARDANPEFWGWDHEFEPDPDREGKLDRRVTIELDGVPHLATIWYNPEKHDIRIRSEALRSAAEIGDILRLDVGDHGVAYRAQIVKPGTEEFETLLELCTVRVRNSQKLFGYV